MVSFATSFGLRVCPASRRDGRRCRMCQKCHIFGGPSVPAAMGEEDTVPIGACRHRLLLPLSRLFFYAVACPHCRRRCSSRQAGLALVLIVTSKNEKEGCVVGRWRAGRPMNLALLSLTHGRFFSRTAPFLFFFFAPSLTPPSPILPPSRPPPAPPGRRGRSSLTRLTVTRGGTAAVAAAAPTPLQPSPPSSSGSGLSGDHGRPDRPSSLFLSR